MRRLRLVVVGLAAIATIALVAAPAHAEELTSEEVTDLAEIAAHDPDARERLERVDRVDGRSIDMERFLDGAEGNEVVERIESLATSDTAAAAPSATQARDDARAILSQRRFHPAPVPRPFRGILETIGRWLDPVLNAIGAFFAWIGDLFGFLALGTGGAFGLWLVIAALVLAITVVRTRAAITERARTRASASLARDPGDDPKRLEVLAAEAEERGDHDLAVRLRFRAGLIRLGAAKVIPRRPSLTTGELRRMLASPDFDRLGITFDEIAYGGRTAAADDAVDARTAWEHILKVKGG